jgi:hypothetical protein
MGILWKPTGELNIATSPSDLPEEGGGNDSISYAMTRCKNMSLVADGKAVTRPGTTNLHNLSGAIPSFIVEQNGVVYSFAAAIYRGPTSIASSLNDSQWSAIKYNQYNDTDRQIFALNGSDRKRINGSTVYDWGITPPDTIPTITTSGTGLTGSYNVKYTYCRKVGVTVVSESNPSDPAAANQTLSNQGLSVTWTASTDAQVTHVRIYRTLTSGTSNYFHDQDVAIGTVTVVTTTTDANLGSKIAIDHDRPPASGSVVAGPFYNGTVFIGAGNLLYYSLTKQPEYFPALNYVEIGQPQFPINAITLADGNVYVETTERIWLIQGTIAGTFNPVPLETLTGAPNLFGAVGVKGLGLYHIGDDGLYVFTGGRDRKMTQGNFEPIFRGNATNNMAAVYVSSRWLHQFENKLYFHYGNGKMLVFNMDNSKWEYREYDVRLTCPCTDQENKRLLAGASDGMVRVLEDHSATKDSGTAFDWEVQSKDFFLQTRAHFPRFIKYDVEGTATGTLILDDDVHQTHALSVDRSVKQRHVKTGNGERAAIRINGSTSTGAATVWAVEFE